MQYKSRLYHPSCATEKHTRIFLTLDLIWLHCTNRLDRVDSTLFPLGPKTIGRVVPNFPECLSLFPMVWMKIIMSSKSPVRLKWRGMHGMNDPDKLHYAAEFTFLALSTEIGIFSRDLHYGSKWPRSWSAWKCIHFQGRATTLVTSFPLIEQDLRVWISATPDGWTREIDKLMGTKVVSFTMSRHVKGLNGTAEPYRDY